MNVLSERRDGLSRNYGVQKGTSTAPPEGSTVSWVLVQVHQNTFEMRDFLKAGDQSAKRIPPPYKTLSEKKSHCELPGGLRG